MIEQMLEFNKYFVENKLYEKYKTSKYPDKKIAIVTCMDTRLVELLPAALGIKNGDVKIIKNAGGTITNPFDSTVRALLVAIYELGVEEVMVVGHTNCGVQGMDSREMLHLMRERGVDEAAAGERPGADRRPAGAPHRPRELGVRRRRVEVVPDDADPSSSSLPSSEASSTIASGAASTPKLSAVRTCQSSQPSTASPPSTASAMTAPKPSQNRRTLRSRAPMASCRVRQRA